MKHFILILVLLITLGGCDSRSVPERFMEANRGDWVRGELKGYYQPSDWYEFKNSTGVKYVQGVSIRNDFYTLVVFNDDDVLITCGFLEVLHCTDTIFYERVTFKVASDRDNLFAAQKLGCRKQRNLLTQTSWVKLWASDSCNIKQSTDHYSDNVEVPKLPTQPEDPNGQ